MVTSGVSSLGRLLLLRGWGRGSGHRLRRHLPDHAQAHLSGLLAVLGDECVEPGLQAVNVGVRHRRSGQRFFQRLADLAELMKEIQDDMDVFVTDLRTVHVAQGEQKR